MYSKWPAFEAAILLVAKQEAKDPFAKDIIRELETRKENNTLTESKYLVSIRVQIPKCNFENVSLRYKLISIFFLKKVTSFSFWF